MENEKIPYKIYLNESEMPRAWYNLRADMKQKPAPLLNQLLEIRAIQNKYSYGAI